MVNAVDFSGRPFHFIGIGGIGMSALAYILAKRGLPVSGSDVRLSHITQRLQDEGVHIFWSQVATNLEFFQRPPAPAAVDDSPPAPVPLLPQIVCSTAIRDQNAEYRSALDLGCPILHRSDLLAALIDTYDSIAVAGTHGKTTTSSLIGYLLVQAGLDPTIVVGGEVGAWDGNARVGQGAHLVAEADESDGSLVKLSAHIGVVTNIELDHPDHYTSLDDVIDIFQVFRQHCQVLVGCIDCETVARSLNLDVTYSLDPASGADYIAQDVHYQATGTVAQVVERGMVLGTLELGLLGQHNLSNALAAVAVGRYLGLEFATIAAALATFEGARRRFEIRGIHRHITFVDDYAHHPSEIRVTLAAAQLRSQADIGAIMGRDRRVIAVFQPHRYSRTEVLMAEFATAFADADQVILTEIYSAGEPNPKGTRGEDLAQQVQRHHDHVTYCSNFDEVYQCLVEILRPGDVVLFLGAGNLNQLIPDVMAACAAAASPAPVLPS